MDGHGGILMRSVDIIIPTRGRVAKLKRMLDSIPGQAFGVRIVPHVMIDGDWQTYLALKEREDIVMTVTEGHHGSVFLRNQEAPRCPDAVLYAVDDMVFKPGALETAIRVFREKFFDDDGVLGFTQVGQAKFHPAGVGLIGGKFMQRFPGRQPFFPGYFLFACQEILWLCDKVSKAEKRQAFWLEPRAVIQHNHPCEHKEEMDQTHHDGRIHKARDMKLIRERQAKGLVWGWG